MAQGTTTVNFGAFPGTDAVAITVTGITGSPTLGEAWIVPTGTADHSADEHLLAAPRVYAAVPSGYDDDDKPKRKRYVVERNGKLVVYASQATALQALEDAPRAAQEPAQEPDPPEVVDLPALQAYAELAGRLEDYTAAYNSRHFEQLMALFDQMQQDEEDIEMLLLAV